MANNGYWTNTGYQSGDTQAKNYDFWNTAAGQKAQNANPYGAYNQQVGGYAQNIMGNVTGNNPWGAGGGSGSWWAGGGVPDLTNETVKGKLGDYMGQMSGNVYNALQQGVNQWGTAGIKRGGQNVVGGPSLQSSLAAQSLNNVASAANSNYKQAVDYLTKYGQGMYSGWKDQANLGTQLLGLQKSGLDSATGYDTDILNMMHGDYTGDVANTNAFNQAAPQQYQQYQNWLAQRSQQQSALQSALNKQQALNYLGSRTEGNPDPWVNRYLNQLQLNSKYGGTF